MLYQGLRHYIKARSPAEENSKTCCCRSGWLIFRIPYSLFAIQGEYMIFITGMIHRLCIQTEEIKKRVQRFIGIVGLMLERTEPLYAAEFSGTEADWYYQGAWQYCSLCDEPHFHLDVSKTLSWRLSIFWYWLRKESAALPPCLLLFMICPMVKYIWTSGVMYRVHGKAQMQMNYI